VGYIQYEETGLQPYTIYGLMSLKANNSNPRDKSHGYSVIKLQIVQSNLPKISIDSIIKMNSILLLHDSNLLKGDSEKI